MDFNVLAEKIKNSREKILVISDTDLDGKMSMVLMNIILKKLNKNFIPYFRIRGENNIELLKIISGIIKNNNEIKTIIFLDTPINDKNLIDFAKNIFKGEIIYIDHHKRKLPEEIPENLFYFDIRAIYNIELCTTSIIYKIGKSLFGPEFIKYSLIAAVGAVGDFMFDYDKELMFDLKLSYRQFYTGRSFTTPFIFYYYLLLILYPYEIIKENIEDILNITDFLKKVNFKYINKTATKYYNYIKDLKKIYESEKLIVFESRSSGTVSTIVSSFYPNKLVVVLSLKDKGIIYRIFKRKERRYKVSLRYQNSKGIDIGKIINEFSKKYGISGGGHPKAAGGLIYERDIKNLINFLEEKLKNEKN